MHPFVKMYSPLVSSLIDKSEYSSVSDLSHQLAVNKQSRQETIDKCNHVLLQWYLRIAGTVWVYADNLTPEHILQCVWNVMVFVGLVFMVISGIFVIGFGNTLHYSHGEKIYLVFLGLTLVCQGLSPCWSYFFIIKRLQSLPPKFEVKLLSSPLLTCCITCAVSLLIGLYSPLFMMDPAQSEGHYSLIYAFAFLWAETAVCLVTASLLYFVLLDCQCTSYLLGRLIDLQAQQQLTFADYQAVREEVRSRERHFAPALTAMVAVILLGFLALLVHVFFDPAHSTPARYLFVASLYVKEIPFLCVLYWELAQVNEKFDRFVVELSSTQWAVVASTEEYLGNNSSSSSYSQLESTRLALCASAQATPITMSLAGRTLRRKDLLWQLGLSCFALFISIVRSIITEAAV